MKKYPEKMKELQKERAEKMKTQPPAKGEDEDKDKTKKSPKVASRKLVLFSWGQSFSYCLADLGDRKVLSRHLETIMGLAGVESYPQSGPIHVGRLLQAFQRGRSPQSAPWCPFSRWRLL